MKNKYKNIACLAQTKRGIKFSFLILLLSICFSCKKYLDVKSDSKEEIPTTIKDCQEILANVQYLNSGSPTDGEVSSDDLFVSDGSFGGVAVDNQGTYEWLPTAMHLNFPNAISWSIPYEGVLYANLVLDTYAKFSAGDKASVAGQNVKGQALFLRSTFFYDLAQLYAPPYDAATANQDLGIPLRLTSTVTEKLTRATVQQTYDQIINDLNTSIPLLPDYSAYTSRPVKAAAYAELARIYLTKGDYVNALINAKACLNIKSTLVDYNTLNLANYYPFSTYPQSNSEVIFHEEMPYSSIIGSSFVSTELKQSYNKNDLRDSLFFSDNGDGTFYFIGSYSGDYNYFTGLATDEMYLVKAECEARAGSTSDALTDLNTLLVNRYRAGTFVPVTANSAEDALSKILTERRKELLYRNTRWADLRRLNRDPRFAITLTRTVKGTNYTLPPNDLRYTLLIPYDAIEYGGYQQNPR